MRMLTGDYKSLQFEVSAAVAAKEWEAFEDMVGFHFAAVASGEESAFVYEAHHLVEVPKKAAAAIARGSALYFVGKAGNTAAHMSPDKADGAFAGYARKAAIAADATVDMILNGANGLKS